MDNLDRTNVVQAALAKWTLNHQLKIIGMLSENEELDDFEALSRGFRESKAATSILFTMVYLFGLQCGPIMQT